ncbi:hypothetical protein SAMN04487770_11123 [Butyrivibrio sp. ob235]|uniref:hypothetical protein n=1 Tax=Butyrivibrio sp. ob235 TaxID=1761780 RepID=UPI0008D267AD|nr:hypothetical protein [Butyrivibrio sp. ob235]SEL48691.1 hypothetical protein SAMN04487770_11123 [Butyrivibrio sp. ob235]
MKRKILAVAIVLIMSISIVACGSSKKGTDTGNTGETTSIPEGKLKATSDKIPETTETTDNTDNKEAASSESAQDENTLAGYYKVISMTTDGEDITAELEQLAAIGSGIFAVINPDGTGQINMMGEMTDFDWDEKYFHMHDDTVSDTDVPYTFADGKLTIAQESDEMIFVRMTDEEKQAYDNGDYDKTIDQLTDEMLDSAYDEATSELDSAADDAISDLDNTVEEATNESTKLDSSYLPDMSSSKHNDTGYYEIMAFQEDSKTYTADQLKKAGVAFDMMLCPDGKGYANFIGTYYDLSWDDGTIYVATDQGQEKMIYFKSDYDSKSIITINDSNMAMVFEYVKEADPSYEWTGVSGVLE